MDVVIIGAGFAGTCMAWMLREAFDPRIVILESDTVPGGMLRTFETPDGLAYEYGPRVVSVFRGTPEFLPFLRGFAKLDERLVYQGTRLRPEFPIVPFPLDRASLRRLPCGEQIDREIAAIVAADERPGEANLKHYLESSLGPTLTELAFEGFNRKFWGRRLEDMPADWGKLRRLETIAEAGDFRLPSRAPHYYPEGGFNPIFTSMLDGFDVRYGVSVERLESAGSRTTVITSRGAVTADVVISTAPIDAIFEYRFGPLEWRGYRLEIEVATDDLGKAPDGVPFAWVYTPWAQTPVCRTTDFGVIHHGRDHDGSRIVVREIADTGVRMYPVWWEEDRLNRYLEAAAAVPGVVPLGRLGLYKYVTMDSTYAMASRLVHMLDEYLGAAPHERVDMLSMLRGDWSN